MNVRSVGAASLLALLSIVARPAAADRGPFAAADTPPRYMPARRYDLQHVRLDLAFDWDAKSVAGTATHTLVPLLPGLDSLVFDAEGLDVHRVRIDGAERPFTVDAQARTLTVKLDRPHDRPYGPADTIVAAIDYDAHPKGGLYFVGPDAGYPAKPRQIYSDGEPDLNRQWFPSWDYPNDRATSEVVATVARPFIVVSNGELVEMKDQPDGRRTFHWRMDVPHAAYLTSVVAGELTRVSDSWRGVPVDYYVPPGVPEDQVRRTFGMTPAVLDYFSQVTGRTYPYAKYAQTAVLDYMAGGMENISATTQTARALHDARAALDYSSEDLVAHEAAHQWFGDLVTCADWSDAWLNEGFASYFATLYRGHAHGDDERDDVLDRDRASYLAEDRESYRRPLVTRRYDDADDLFDVTLYSKGALVLHMLHDLLGEEGWWKGIRAYVERYAAATATTQDFQEAMEAATGASLGPFFDQWVYGAGYPELKVRWDWQPETRQVHLEVRQTQELDAATGLFSFPLEVSLVGEDGKETVVRVPVAARALQDLYVPIDPNAERPRTVVLDPRGVLLATVDFAKPVPEWIAQLQTARPLPAKLAAIRALGKLGGGDAVAALGRALREEPYYGSRRAAAKELAGLGGPEALAALRSGLADKDSRVRTLVLERLRRFPDHPELVPLLGRALTTEESYFARAAAAEALGAFEDQRDKVAPLLLAALGQDSFHELVRGAALGSLGTVDPARAFAPALRLARYGAPADVRDDALRTLAALGQRDPRRRDEVRKVLEGYLDDPDYVVREGVYDDLAALGDPAAIPAIERQGRAEATHAQRRRAADAVRDLQKAAAAAKGEDKALRDRVEQLERESEVLKERLRVLEEATPRPAPSAPPPPAPPPADR